MKDQNDNATLDAFEAPRRGRPRKADALSNAERQRLWRQRQKALDGCQMRFTYAEARFLRALLKECIRPDDEDDELPMVLLRRFEDATKTDPYPT